MPILMMENIFLSFKINFNYFNIVNIYIFKCIRIYNVRVIEYYIIFSNLNLLKSVIFKLLKDKKEDFIVFISQVV